MPDPSASREMRLFDALPPSVRAYIHDAELSVPAEVAHSLVQQHGASGAIAALRKGVDRLVTAEAEAFRAKVADRDSAMAADLLGEARSARMDRLTGGRL